MTLETGPADAPPRRQRSAPTRGDFASAGYQARFAILILILAFYPSLAVLAPSQGRAEFYPFFSWNLFASSSSQKVDAVIIVREINGRALEEPRLFFDLKDDFAASQKQDIGLAKLLDNYVLATLRGETEFPASLRNAIETTYMGDVPEVTYDIAVIRYHPLERYENGTIQEIQIFASHKKTSQ